jgi:hypothetical protein
VPGCEQEGSEQGKGGQPGSPLAEAEISASKPSSSAQSTRAATSSSDVPPTAN